MSTKPFSIAYLIGDTVTNSRHDNRGTAYRTDDCVQETVISDLKLPPVKSKTALSHGANSNNSLIDKDNDTDDLIMNKGTVVLKDYHPALRNVSVHLEGSTLWNKFHAYGTEMIVTKTGR